MADKNNNYSFEFLKEPIPISEQKWPENIAPLVHTKTWAYNHGDYIRACIEGILMQKTTFPVQVLIHDDASTDSTRSILRDYQAKYPNLIRVFYQKENVYSIKDYDLKVKKKEIFQSWCIGKYEAMCEGDDYWIDPMKLQKQVEVLENDKNISLSFHNAVILWEDQSVAPRYFCSKNQKKISQTGDVIKKWFVPTASIVYRTSLLDEDYMKFKYKMYSGDWSLQLYLSTKGDLHYTNKIMSVYRKQPTSQSFNKQNNTQFVNIHKIELLRKFDIITDYNYKNEIKEKIMQLTTAINKANTYQTFPLLKYLRLKKILEKLSEKL